MTLLQKKRLEYHPEVSPLFKNCVFEPCAARPPHPDLHPLFPNTFDRKAFQLVAGKGRPPAGRVGVLFSGGPAAGGHNVVAGLCDQVGELIGFLNGAAGLVDDKWKKLSSDVVALYRNQGGFDLIGTGRTKIETAEQLRSAKETCERHKLDGLVIIGGDDSNTNAAVLAEYFLKENCRAKVVGVPKTIDGDLRSEDIEISFGFDSATKTYSEMIGNIARDAASARKYYHFIKLMGRSASHVTLECALATQPNLALIGEEGLTLPQIVQKIVEVIQKRAAVGKSYGVILIPEGLAEFMSMAGERDPHGNLAVSQIQTEEVMISMVKKQVKIEAQGHFLGYEGRSCLPTNFDAKYAYSLGLLAAVAIREKLTGVICSVQNLAQGVDQWKFKMVPIVGLMHFEMRKEKKTAVIQKALVDIKGKSFVHFSRIRASWEVQDEFRYPGPIQFYGGADLSDTVPISLTLDRPAHR